MADPRTGGVSLHPSATRDVPLRPPRTAYHGLPCGAAGCIWAVRFQDNQSFFVHDGVGRYAMRALAKEDLMDVDLDIWSEQVKPWILRLHEGEPA